MASALVRVLSNDKAGSLFRRLGVTDIPAEKYQNLTISEAVNSFMGPDLLGKIVNGQLIKRRLCDATDEKTIERARIILNSYFERIMQAHPKQREDGKDGYMYKSRHSSTANAVA
ncbi:hypothetical protein RLOatenuis_6540 [Rickettsiales bacterium]|nr:hypothetical protein RLOatenuis_6540 [Rickettsiales bacterium]